MNSIVVVDNQWGIGRDNNLLFRLPLDLGVNFVQKTAGKVVVMGANTYYSLPASRRPLANRTNIVLDNSGTVHSGTITVDTLDKLYTELAKYNTNDIFVIGGASVYSLLLDKCDTVYVTKVDSCGDATVFYPNLDANKKWQCVYTSQNIIDNGYNTTYNTYIKSV